MIKSWIAGCFPGKSTESTPKITRHLGGQAMLRSLLLSLPRLGWVATVRTWGLQVAWSLQIGLGNVPFKITAAWTRRKIRKEFCFQRLMMWPQRHHLSRLWLSQHRCCAIIRSLFAFHLAIFRLFRQAPSVKNCVDLIRQGRCTLLSVHLSVLDTGQTLMVFDGFCEAV